MSRNREFLDYEPTLALARRARLDRQAGDRSQDKLTLALVALMMARAIRLGKANALDTPGARLLQAWERSTGWTTEPRRATLMGKPQAMARVALLSDGRDAGEYSAVPMPDVGLFVVLRVTGNSTCHYFTRKPLGASLIDPDSARIQADAYVADFLRHESSF